MQSLGELIDGGYDVETAYGEIVGQDFEQTFDAAVERLERKQGRTILQSEINALWEHATDQDDPEDLPSDKLLDTDKPADRAAFIDERLNPPPDPVETVAPLDVDASDRERQEWVEARIAGAEVEASEDASEDTF